MASSLLYPIPRAAVRAFGASGRRHFLITGSRGAGKSTLLAAVLPLLGAGNAPDILTFARPKQAVFLRRTATGECTRIGAFDASLPGPDTRMRPIPEGFCTLGTTALAAAPDGGWVSVDEIGYLETACAPYCDALRAAFARCRVVAAVRKADLPFLQELLTRPDVFVLDLDRPLDPGCVILASGLGVRFGPGGKLLVPFCGRPLLGHALDATNRLFSPNRRVVVTRSEAAAAFCRGEGVPVRLHALPHRSDTIRLGLEALGDPEGCLFCPADQPRLTAETVQALLFCAAHDPGAVWRPAHGGEPGAPVFFPQFLLPRLKTLAPGQGGRSILKDAPCPVRLLDCPDARELADIDTPEALAALEAAANP